MAHSSARTAEERRAKFRLHASFFDSATRFPAPFVQFTGRPGAFNEGTPYDAMGFRNAAAIAPRDGSDETRVFVVGDSTMVAGDRIDDTVPGRLETILRAHGLADARVHNFGVMSSCLNQMLVLIWTRLLDYEPDLIVVVSGATDLFQPWSFDPRPGYPYNTFVIQYLYDYFFDPYNYRAQAEGLSYDELLDNSIEVQDDLRKRAGWKTEAWERDVVAEFARALRRLEGLARSARVPIVYVLEPVVVRKEPLAASEADKASPDFLAYLARQYDRLDGVIGGFADGRLFRARNASRALNAAPGGLFEDIVHYDATGRATMAGTLAREVVPVLRQRRRSGWVRRLQGLARAVVPAR